MKPKILCDDGVLKASDVEKVLNEVLQEHAIRIFADLKKIEITYNGQSSFSRIQYLRRQYESIEKKWCE